MRLDNYTTKVFLENFIKDSEVFGEETTQAIYEEIFSTVSGRKVKLDGFVKILHEEVDENLTEEPADLLYKGIGTVKPKWTGPDNWAFADNLKKAQILDTAKTVDNAIAQTGGWVGADKWAQSDVINKLAKQSVTKQKYVNFFSKIGGFLKGLPGKVKNFFGNLQGKSFSEIMNQGMGWLQANPMLALKTTGGIALVMMLIKALKKKGQLNQYKQLAAIEARQSRLHEDCFDTVFGDTPEKSAMRKVIEECQTNKALNELMFGENKKAIKDENKIKY